MIRTFPAAIAALTLALAAPAAAQSASQDAMEARHDRALAAGYKALMLCSALANAERAGGERTAESVARWELAGIQAPLDRIVAELPHRIMRLPGGGEIASVLVEFAQDFSRIAIHDSQRGCRLLPIAARVPPIRSIRTAPPGSRDTPFVEARRDMASIDAAFDGDMYGEGTRTTAVLVMRNRVVEAERYAADFGPDVPQRTWSVAKSIAATLVGAAVMRGEADETGSAGLGRSADDPRRAITIDQTLRMASGRYSDTPGNRTDPLYFGGATVEETALHWPMLHEPGTVFRYANNDTLAAVEAIEPTFHAHPPAELFAALGMDGTVAETDWRGSYILSSQVWSTARDLAKLGQLYLDGGVAPDGTRVLPEGWVEYVSGPDGPQPDGPFGYGAGFWLLNASEGVPPDTFAAMGNRGQYVVIVPSRDLVIVRRGEDPAGSRFDIAGFTRDMLAAFAEGRS